MIAVFLDLDGTLMDSRPGIEAALRHAFVSIDRPDLAEMDLKPLIGPPFKDSFPKFGITDINAALEAYRHFYDAGAMFEASPYDGVIDALHEMHGQDLRLYLATAKPHVSARKITKHFGISSYLLHEFGPELDGTRDWKGDLLAHALEVTGENPENSVMVGDRHHDMAAAEEVGMPAIAVTWGYGHSEEWKTAEAIIDHPSSLLPTVRDIQL